MIWLTWRQFRGSAAMMAAALVVLAVALALTGPNLASDYAAGIADCTPDNTCLDFFDRFFGQYDIQLNRNGRDVPEATMPALAGDRKADWAAFETAYRKVTDQVPDLRDKLAVVTLEAIVAALGDNHARWAHQPERPLDYYDGDGYGLGLEANVSASQVNDDPGVALPTLFAKPRRPTTSSTCFTCR
jgi:hypothetical protein